MNQHLLPPVEKVESIRITENPSLYGLVVREQGELVEFVSYAEARRRVEARNVPRRPRRASRRTPLGCRVI